MANVRKEQGMSSSRFEGKVVVVTGSTRGIGKGIALRFGDEGANVVVSGRTSDDGEEVVEDIRGLGGDAPLRWDRRSESRRY